MSPIEDAHSIKIVRAGAGAGKTWNLTREVIGQALVVQRTTGDWPSMVVTTFTRKATQELRERILAYCLEEAPEALEFARSEATLFITTIHGLLDRFLRQYGEHLGWPQSYQIIDQRMSQLLKKQVLASLFNGPSSYGELLENFDFRKIVRFLNHFSDLSEVQKKKYATFEDQSQQCLALWNDCRLQLRKTAQRIYDLNLHEKWQDYCEKILNTPWEISNSWGEQREAIGYFLENIKKPRKSKNCPGLPDNLNDSLKEVLTTLKNFATKEEYNPEVWKQSETVNSQFLKLVEDFFPLYFDHKKKKGWLELCDLETLSVELIEQVPKSGQEFASQWSHWFIDEYQDTSPRQVELLECFISNKKSYRVGDPQQSIYLFRGARSEVFQRAEESVLRLGGERLLLKDNYRSEKPLLEFINDLCKGLGNEFQSMGAKKASQGRDIVGFEIIQDDQGLATTGLNSECEKNKNEKNQDEKNQDEKNHLGKGPSDGDQDEQVERMIYHIGNWLKEGIQPQDIGVLARTNGQLLKLERAFLKAGIPCISHMSTGFFLRQEVLDAMTFLKFILSPSDNYNLIQLLRGPWIPISDKDIVNILANKDLHYWPQFKKFFQDTQWEPGLRLVELLRACRTKGIAWCFRRALVEFGFFDSSLYLDSSGRREANLWKLVHQVEKISREPEGKLFEFVQNASTGANLEQDPAGDASAARVPNKVNIMTVHASKGLQFPYIVLPFLEKRPQVTTFGDFIYDDEKQYWSLRGPGLKGEKSLGSPVEKFYIQKMRLRELDESKRLLYVAVTRAEKFVLFLAKSRCAPYSWGEQLSQIFPWDHGHYERPNYSYFVNTQPLSLKTFEPKVHFEEASILPWSDSKPRFEWFKEQQILPEPNLNSPLALNHQSVEESRDWAQGVDPSKKKDSLKLFETEVSLDGNLSIDQKKPTTQKTLKSFLASHVQRRRGIEIHEIFEKLAFSTQLTKRELVHHLGDVVGEFVFNLKSPPLFQIMTEGNAEWAFRKKESHDKKIEGRIDLWGIVTETLWVVDYKTGRAHDTDKVFEQLRAYAKVLSEFVPREEYREIKMAAVYPLKQTVDICSWEPSELER